MDIDVSSKDLLAQPLAMYSNAEETRLDEIIMEALLTDTKLMPTNAGKSMESVEKCNSSISTRIVAEEQRPVFQSFGDYPEPPHATAKQRPSTPYPNNKDCLARLPRPHKHGFHREREIAEDQIYQEPPRFALVELPCYMSQPLPAGHHTFGLVYENLQMGELQQYECPVCKTPESCVSRTLLCKISNF